MHVIGIRGTDHETFATSEGTFNRVTLGGTVLEGTGGRVELAPGEAGFASLGSGSAPVRLERTPEFMHLAALTRDARPQMRGAQLRGPSAGDEKRLHKSAQATTVAPSAKPLLQPEVLKEKRKGKDKLK